MTSVIPEASTATPDPRDQHAPTALYRLYDIGGTLLYIGVTDNPDRRFKQHRDTKPWWPQVAKKTIEWHPSRDHALAEEATAIKAETPAYNLDHNPAAVSYHWPPAGMPTDRIDAVEREASTLPADLAEGVRRAAWEGFTRAQLAEPASTPTGQLADDNTTCLAAGLYAATVAYNEALTRPNPAAALDDMCDALPGIMTEINATVAKAFKVTSNNRVFAETLQAAIADRLWAFTVVEHAKAEAGDSYGYVFDVMADSLKRGADPQAIRAEVPRVVERLRSASTVDRILEARDKADGPWAKILDIVLDTIEEGADPQAVIDQVVGLMEQVIDEGKAAA